MAFENSLRDLRKSAFGGFCFLHIKNFALLNFPAVFVYSSALWSSTLGVLLTFKRLQPAASLEAQFSHRVEISLTNMQSS